MSLTLRLLLIVLGMLTAHGAWSQGQVAGYVAVVKKEGGIFAEKSSNSHMYFPAKPGMQIVVRVVEDPWAGVVMADGRLGWIKAAFVEVTDHVAYWPEQGPPRDQQQLASRKGDKVVEEARKYVGTPYVWGGNDLQGGVDCSGFVKKLYGQIGENLPRTAAQQAKVGTPILRLEHLQPGDRLYFCDASRTRINHTGIYMGGGNFIHSARSKGGVSVDTLFDPKWRNKLVAARR